MSKQQGQRGDILIIVVVAAVVVLLLGGGWWAWKHHQGQAKTVSSSSTKTVAKTDGGAADPSLNQAAQQAATLAACGSLVLSQGTSNGTAGTMYKDAVVTNTGSQTCTVSGYPTVKLLDGGGAVLGSAAGQNPLYPATTVSIPAGGEAHVVLGFPDAGAYDPSTCSVASTTLQMTISGVAVPLTTAWADQSCPDFSTTVFQTGA